MNRTEFEELEIQVQQSGLSLKSYLRQIGVSYSTYHYWQKSKHSKKYTLHALWFDCNFAPHNNQTE